MNLRDKVKVTPFGFKQPVDGTITGLYIEDQADGTEKVKVNVKYLTPTTGTFDSAAVNIISDEATKEAIKPSETSIPN